MERSAFGVGILVATWLVAVPATADFTFKRVKPPSEGAKRLITIQVEPTASVAPTLSNTPNVPDLADPAAPGPRPKIGDTATWFWSKLSPALSDARRGKLAQAMQVLAGDAAAANGFAADPTRLQQIVARYGDQILKATANTQVSPALVASVIAVESAGRPAAKSSAGAVGLMQLMPATAKRFGVTDRTDPAQNISGGVKYLDFLLGEFGGDALLTLAAYNAGEGAVQRAGGVPNYDETRAYVPKVVGAWAQARLLCLSPPDKATDGCLFLGTRIAQQ